MELTDIAEIEDMIAAETLKEQLSDFLCNYASTRKYTYTLTIMETVALRQAINNLEEFQKRGYKYLAERK